MGVTLDDLLTRPDGWDGYGAPAPNPLSVQRAKTWLDSARSESMTQLGFWAEPHVSSDEDGEVSLEWWSGRRRKLTVYVAPDSIEYIKVEKSKHLAKLRSLDMQDGEIHSLEDWPELWRWLNAHLWED